MYTREERQKGNSGGSQGEQRGVFLSRPVLLKFAEWGIRLFLSGVLATGEIFGTYSPFGVAMVAASGGGFGGAAALIGACIGYLGLYGFTNGLRYVSVAVLVFAISFAFYDIPLFRKVWLMPMIASGLTGSIGVVYLSLGTVSLAKLVFFLSEIVLTGGGAYFYKIAFSAWEKQEEAEYSERQKVSLLILCMSLLISLEKVTVMGISVGRAVAAFLVLASAFQGGAGAGSVVGVAVGVSMGTAAGGTALYCMAYAFSGLLSGTAARIGRLFCALTYVLAEAVALLWSWQGELQTEVLYEGFAASLVFFLLPVGWLSRLGEQWFGTRTQEKSWDRQRVRRKLEEMARGFRELYEEMRNCFVPQTGGGGEIAGVFDRTAEKVCRKCGQAVQCWQRDYVGTYNALNDASVIMMERGQAEAGDFPKYFSTRCQKFSEFLKTINEELAGVFYRRQYRSRLQESRAAVCRQYAQLSEFLEMAAMEAATELSPDELKRRKLKRYLIDCGVEGDCRVYMDRKKRLKAEIFGEGLGTLRGEETVSEISNLLGVSVCHSGTEKVGDREVRLWFRERAPITPMIGAAARCREGEQMNGDAGTYFRTEDGILYVILSDGMGSGEGAAKESVLALQILKRFLIAGMEAENALKTANSALILRSEVENSFATIDLLEVDLFGDGGTLYKYGGAPSFVRREGKISRITGGTLPAGLGSNGTPPPDVTRIPLEAGDVVLLVSDGVAGGEADDWIMEQLASYEPGGDPKALAAELIGESEKRKVGKDDRTVLVVELRKTE